MYSDFFLRDIWLKPIADPSQSYVCTLPVVQALGKIQRLSMEAPVTFLVGENGAGKSTLLEAIAVAFRLNEEGGSRNFRFSTTQNDDHAPLYPYLGVTRGVRRPRDSFFLRAESFYNVATELERIHRWDDTAYLPYGDKSLHSQSHGESFLSLVCNRFRGNGLYLLDEPEAALSPQSQLSLLRAIHRLVKNSSQLVIATHSPILMAYPGARILVLQGDTIQTVPYRETEHYRLTRQFLEQPERILQLLLDEES